MGGVVMCDKKRIVYAHPYPRASAWQRATWIACVVLLPLSIAVMLLLSQVGNGPAGAA